MTTYNQSKYVQPKAPFSGGYVDNTQPFLLEDGESPYLRNVRTDGYGISIRPGHSLQQAYPNLATYLSLYPGKSLIVKSGAVFYANDINGNLLNTATYAPFNADAHVNFENGLGDVVYGYNGIQLPVKIDTGTYAYSPGVTANPATVTNFFPLFAVVFNGSMWASGNSSTPGKVYKSVGQLYEDFGGTGSDVLPFNSTITGLASNTQALFYFSKEQVWATSMSDITTSGSTVSYYYRNVETQEGSTNHQSIVTAGDSVYYVTPSNKIVKVLRGQSIDGFESKQLSHRKYKGIEGIMGTLARDQADCFGYYVPSKNLVKWHFKKAGGTFNDVCVVYDVSKDVFLVDSNKYFQHGCSWQDRSFTVSDIENKLYRDEFGTDDEDMPVSFAYYTKPFAIGDPTIRKELWEKRTFLSMNALANPTVQIVMDGSVVYSDTLVGSDTVPSLNVGVGTAEVGTFMIGDEASNKNDVFDVRWLATKGNLRKRGATVQFRYTCNSLAAKMTLQNVDFRAAQLPPQAANRTTGT